MKRNIGEITLAPLPDFPYLRKRIIKGNRRNKLCLKSADSTESLSQCL